MCQSSSHLQHSRHARGPQQDPSWGPHRSGRVTGLSWRDIEPPTSKYLEAKSKYPELLGGKGIRLKGTD